MIIHLIFTTILFGSSILFLIKRRLLQILTHLTIGWLIGATSTSFFLFILTYFVEFQSSFAYYAMLLHVLFSIAAILIVKYARGVSFTDLFKTSIESNPWLYFLIIVSLIYVITLNSRLFVAFPNHILQNSKYDVETDHTMATSIFVGINRKRQSFFQLKDPMVVNGTYLSSPTIHYYTALLVGLNAPFHDISFAISFLNTFASAISLFHLASYYHKYQAFAAMCVLLNGGWAFIRNFTVRNNQVDLIHNVGREYHVPMYQIFTQFIVFSKSYSFALPMAIFSLILIHKFATTNEQYENYMIAGILISLCPSFMVSASLAIYTTCQLYAVIFACPMFVSFIIKILYSNIKSQPIWREYQMNGIFFAQIVSWIDALGPFSIMIILAPFFITGPDIVHKYVSMLCSICLISFYRNGAYLYDNAAAIAFTILPVLVNITFSAFSKYVKKLKEKPRGILIGSFSLIVLLSILGGIISNRRQLMIYEPCTDQEALTASRWVAMHVPMNETVLTVQMPFNPISFSAGRQIFSSIPYNIWMRGEDFAKPTSILRQIDALGGAPNLMRKYNMKYLLEFIPFPLVSRNRNLLEQFMIVESSERWSLLKLHQS